MGTQYDQLDLDECYELYCLHEDGKGVREIGRPMGHSPLPPMICKRSKTTALYAKRSLSGISDWLRCFFQRRVEANLKPPTPPLNSMTTAVGD